MFLLIFRFMFGLFGECVGFLVECCTGMHVFRVAINEDNDRI